MNKREKREVAILTSWLLNQFHRRDAGLPYIPTEVIVGAVRDQCEKWGATL